RPVGIRDLGDDLAAFLDRVEDGADVELLVERRLDADLDVVEVDEDGDVETILRSQMTSLVGSVARSGWRLQPYFAAVELDGSPMNRKSFYFNSHLSAISSQLSALSCQLRRAESWLTVEAES